MPETTPRPWDYDEDDLTLYSLEDTEWVGLWAVPPSREDVYLIVRAVNSHDLLLEAAEAALKLFDEYAIEEEHPQKIAALRTAINAAKGNQQ